MQNSFALKVENLSKSYKLYKERNTSIKYRFLDFITFKSSTYNQLQALSDLTFEVPKGQTLGIIGENGSGKSTLLKILAGILLPTSGNVKLNGKVSSLLELGSGFSSELTGRKNIYLNGSILGFERKKIDESFDDIVSYSGLEDFIDTPIKNYSAGMLMRLGFAIAIKVDPDILMIDEVLAVGDEGFQRKCFEDITQFKRKRKTIVFVSHDASAVERLCDRVLLLHHGKIVSDGASDNVIRNYRLMLSDKESAEKEKKHIIVAPPKIDEKFIQDRHGTQEAEITSVSILKKNGISVDSLESGETGKLVMDILFRADIEDPIFGFIMRKDDGQRLIDVYDTNTSWQKIKTGKFKKGDKIKASFDLDFRLGRGEYYFTCAVASKDTAKFFDWRENCFKLWVEEKGYFRAIADLNAKISIER